MKPSVAVFLLFGMVLLLVLQGFQCASSEFTGAKLQMQQNNYKEAQRLLEIEVQKNPTNDEAWYLLGLIRGEEQEYPGMNDAFNAALELSQKHAGDIRNIQYNYWGQHLNVGVTYLELATPESSHYYEKSIEEFQFAAAAWPDTALTYRYLGYAFNNKGDFNNALEAFRTGWEKGKDSESLKRMARIYVHRGDQYKMRFEGENSDKLKAVKNLGGIQKNSRKSDVIAALGAPDNIRRGPRGSRKENLIYNRYNLTVSIDNEKVTEKRFSKPYNPAIDSTNHRLALREYDQAIQVVQEARGTLAKDPEILSILLAAYVQADRIQEATAEYERAVADEPENKASRYILGVLYRSAGDYQKAVEEFQKAYDLDASYYDALFDLGATYYNWGVDLMRSADEKAETSSAHKDKFKMALPYVEKVSELKPDDVQVWETLGTIYAQLGMQDKAIKAFDKADRLRAGN
ncbi:MAG: tetratricopeptide repeat protein [Ignavibacteriales bacterium]|nr:tetratricopeptide repeat protein [Ignavibacteriales bacterium]